eukprot:5750883-Pyramimonas_sp.AAC.1
MEMAFSVHHQQEDFEPLRGAGPQLKWQLSQAAPGHLSDPVGEQWGIVHTLILRTVSLAKHGRDPKQLSDCFRQLQRHVAHFQSSDTSGYFGTSGQEERDRWLCWSATIPSASHDELGDWSHLTERLVHRAQARLPTKGRQQFTKWALEQWRQHPWASSCHGS